MERASRGLWGLVARVARFHGALLAQDAVSDVAVAIDAHRGPEVPGMGRRPRPLAADEVTIRVAPGPLAGRGSRRRAARPSLDPEKELEGVPDAVDLRVVVPGPPGIAVAVKALDR